VIPKRILIDRLDADRKLDVSTPTMRRKLFANQWFVDDAFQAATECFSDKVTVRCAIPNRAGRKIVKNAVELSGR
jgi:hypothetical protein